MRKILKLSIIAFFILISALLWANYRYAFWSVKGGGWSIGTNTLSEFFIENPVKNSKIFSIKWLNQQTEENSIFLADPFLFVENNVYYIFFEHQAEGNANIGLIKSLDGKNYSFEGNVLNEKFHLSFPQVFKVNEEYYMLPETKETGHVLLYRTDNFPFDWKILDTLIKNVSYKDPAILLSDTLKIISVSDDKLKQSFYRADSLRGEWKPEIRFKHRFGDETRAGGNFFQINGEWFLPLQKNNRGYGSGISIFRLKFEKNELKLEKHLDTYLDKIDSIEWFNRGMHHISVFPVNDKFEVAFDGDIKNLKNKKDVNWKASLKYNFYDLKKFFKELVPNK
ncbi:glycoside hydrolase family 32 protein [Antarcticibacterium flavum]|uniref:Glycoside hydrolase family 32 protein n=1 Tax=Antarcticibacterium flavum TaxID=2058175 RepID=A0A5B7X7J6_9FLAO|nr:MULTISPECIES: glycoside hydrolase family 32 protein [Antarcticibacterium]MCM4161384.1 hypothetical protein [Antarcticibacterium sp. W02-3]QCY70591.1 glycoside hydrolase family 32 protein [Antarcticibacterium flavum]